MFILTPIGQLNMGQPIKYGSKKWVKSLQSFSSPFFTQHSRFVTGRLGVAFFPWSLLTHITLHTGWYLDVVCAGLICADVSVTKCIKPILLILWVSTRMVMMHQFLFFSFFFFLLEQTYLLLEYYFWGKK